MSCVEDFREPHSEGGRVCPAGPRVSGTVRPGESQDGSSSTHRDSGEDLRMGKLRKERFRYRFGPGDCRQQTSSTSGVKRGIIEIIIFFNSVQIFFTLERIFVVHKC